MDSKEASSSQNFQKPEELSPISPSTTAPEASEGSQSGTRSRSHSRTRSRSTRVTAARTRSRRTSDASLRVIKRNATTEPKAPPVPRIPVEFDAEESFLDIDSASPNATRAVSYKRGKPHPYSTSGNHSYSAAGRPGPSSAVPSFWISADTPKKSPKKRASIQQQHSDPLMRRTSGGRSNSRYSHMVSPTRKPSRHSLPPRQSGSDGLSSNRPDTP